MSLEAEPARKGQTCTITCINDLLTNAAWYKSSEPLDEEIGLCDDLAGCTWNNKVFYTLNQNKTVFTLTINSFDETFCGTYVCTNGLANFKEVLLDFSGKSLSF